MTPSAPARQKMAERNSEPLILSSDPHPNHPNNKQTQRQPVRESADRWHQARRSTRANQQEKPDLALVKEVENKKVRKWENQKKKKKWKNRKIEKRVRWEYKQDEGRTDEYNSQE